MRSSETMDDWGLRRRKEPERGADDDLALRSHHICRARLKRSATMSAILCAFSLQSMAELQVKVPTLCPPWIFTMFAVCTTSLIAIHILSLVITNFILPGLDYMGGSQDTLLKMIHEYPNNNDVRNFVEVAWTFTTLLGLFLFLIEIVLLCWVKFYDHSLMACWAGTFVMSPFIVGYLGICGYFHRVLSQTTYQLRVEKIKDLEILRNELELDGLAFTITKTK